MSNLQHKQDDTTKPQASGAPGGCCMLCLVGNSVCLKQQELKPRINLNSEYFSQVSSRFHLWPTHSVTDSCGCLWSKMGFVASVTASTAMSRCIAATSETLSHWKSAKTRFPGCVKGTFLKLAEFPMNVSTVTLFEPCQPFFSPSLGRFARQCFPNKHDFYMNPSKVNTKSSTQD